MVKNYNEIETDIRQENTKMEIKKGKVGRM